MCIVLELEILLLKQGMGEGRKEVKTTPHGALRVCGVLRCPTSSRVRTVGISSLSCLTKAPRPDFVLASYICQSSVPLSVRGAQKGPTSVRLERMKGGAYKVLSLGLAQKAPEEQDWHDAERAASSQPTCACL